MKNLLLFWTLALCLTSYGQSKKQQIVALNYSIDSLNVVLSITKNKAAKDIGRLNKTIGDLSKKIAQLKSDVSSLESSVSTLEKDKAKLTHENEKFKTYLEEISKTNMELEAMVKILNNEIASKKRDIDSLSNPKIDKENNWLLIENNLKWIEKDHSTTIEWFNKTIERFKKNISYEGQDIFTPSCYSYMTDAMNYYWGYPGSIEEDEFKSKWKSIFDLKYSSFGHSFQNGNCGWASCKLENIEFLGSLNDGEWYKLTVLGGCGENDYSRTLVRVVKIIEENGSFRIANFISLRDE